MKYPFPKSSLYIPMILLILIWSTFLLQNFGLGSYNCYGIVPRNFIGLRGIILGPLFHGGWKHIINNSIPLAVLSFFAVLFYERIAYYVIIFGWLLTGLMVWLIGNLFPEETIGCHIGASGIVYLLASYVFFSGILKKSRNLIAISLIVVFLYGGMIWGVFPEEYLPKLQGQNSNPISWESHLAGGVIGLIFAFITRKYGPETKKYSWEEKSEPDASEQWLWEKYKASLPEDERVELEKKYGEWKEKEIEIPENKPQKDDDDYWFSTDTRNS
ncbi:MAG: rhomboid family intramembrane serine protease [Weeksellaceae bacterium]